MKELLKKGKSFIIILFIPGFILTLLYITSDPFQVVKRKSFYSYSPIEPNRDFISTENYLQNDKYYHYNSFIFGSSRATSFKVNLWLNYIENNSVPFAFDAAGESLYGISKKIKFLDSKKEDLNNVLILFCRDGFFQIKNPSDRLTIKHPLLSGEGWIRFHLVSFKSFCNLKFLIGYYFYIITGKENPFSQGIIQNKGIFVDPITNQIDLKTWDDQLYQDSKKYYESRFSLFYNQRTQSFEANAQLTDEHLFMLNEIEEILDRNNSDYKIILSPIYDEVKFAIKDKDVLKEIFGDHLYDFTGKNFITENDTNWYEPYHFRPFIADSILKIVYSKETRGSKYR